MNNSSGRQVHTHPTAEPHGDPEPAPPSVRACRAQSRKAATRLLYGVFSPDGLLYTFNGHNLRFFPNAQA
ncbi:MAG: hypothetical protein GY859_01795 [Desulfobacterales bacterium]|nr:hypothetical protein [Desulfobacterales bacterium]